VREFALSQSDAELLCTVAGERGHSAAIADLAGCYDRAGLLARVADALEFPDSFGSNWEALFDCLVDLSWLPAPGHILVLLNTAELRRDAPEAFDTALSIIREAATLRQKHGGSLRTIVDAPASRKRAARKRRRGNGNI
jgi:RNAse (barnase) inhibitor barstar